MGTLPSAPRRARALRPPPPRPGPGAARGARRAPPWPASSRSATTGRVTATRTSSRSPPRPRQGGRPLRPRPRRRLLELRRADRPRRDQALVPPPDVGRPRRARAAGARREIALGETIGAADDGLAAAELRADLEALVARLSPTERTALRLRFEHDMTQAEIATVLGVSQIRVSRVLRQALERLRRL